MGTKNISTAIIVLMLSLGSISCKKKGGGNPGPSPSASPSPSPFQSPSPTPKTRGPLKIKAGEATFFDRDDRPIYFTGAVTCCKDPFTKETGWPLINTQTLQIFAEHKANYAHIRLGPFAPEGEGADFAAYQVLPDGRQDLNAWNPAFWQRVRQTIQAAANLGIYVEVDLIDNWLFKHSEFSAWTGANNVNDVDQGNCSTVSKAPGSLQERWVRKAIDETGQFDNVFYQIGNETMDCDGRISNAFELGVAAIARDQLTARGFGRRLIGTNSHKESIERSVEIDYVARHVEDVPSPVFGKPMLVNESSDEAALDFPEKLDEAYFKGTHWILWRSNTTDPQWQENLRYMRDFTIRNGLAR